ncbi:YpfB family protein [Niallia sp. 01092]|uniref:YpfB family protein n=1 Tax=unclassified Niallia TaxID=2837522 RepID=UPI003FD18970
MKRFERLLVKVIVIQLLFLAISQLIHAWNIFPQLYELAQYEGVSKSNFSKILETFQQH